MKLDKIKILVEGSDDLHSIRHLYIKKSNLDLVSSLKEFGGIDELLRTLPVYLKSGELELIAIIIDANSDIVSRWKEVSNILVEFNIQIPEQPQAGGFIHAGDKKIGIWVMPDNNRQGYLDDFLLTLIPEDDELHKIANQTIKEIISKGFRKFKEQYESKAILRTWLAWQDVPGHPYGLSIKRNFYDLDKLECNQFIAWLNNLLGLHKLE